MATAVVALALAWPGSHAHAGTAQDPLDSTMCGPVPPEQQAAPTTSAVLGGALGLTIPPAVFWRQVFPGMLLLLAIATVVSFGYLQLRRQVARRRQAEIRLAEARDLADSAALAKSQFLATISHEIRTPLSGIIGMLDLLKRGALVEDQRNMLVSVDTAAKALLQILDQVMDYSKVEANRMSLESIPVNLRQLLHSVVMVVGEPARRRGVDTPCRFDDAVCHEVLGDPLRIRQILSNLISNAAKFTSSGEVALTVSVEESTAQYQRLRFVVADTGVGIEPAKLAHIMAPFGQADASTSRQYGGSGLGLSVSSRLAALMGGRLELDSEVGKGTSAVFSCRFPVHRRHDEGTGEGATTLATAAPAFAAFAPRAGDEGAANPARAARMPRALVVDDHAINRELMQRQMVALGYDCETCADGASALKMLCGGDFAMLLTDCHMPAMSGAQLARAWRQVESQRGVASASRMPVIIVTAVADPAHALSSDVQASLGKPVSMEQLRAVLLACLPSHAITPALVRAGCAADPGVNPARHALDALGRQFGDDRSGLRDFVQKAVEVLRADLQQADLAIAPVTPKSRESVAAWLHRFVGALSMLGQWPVIDEAGRLQEKLRNAQHGGPDPDMRPLLQHFAQTLDAIEAEVAKL